MAHYVLSWSRVGFMILAFLGGWAIDAWPAPASYTLIDLGNTFPEAIADDGTVVGSAFTPDQQAAILYPTLTLLTPAGGRANGISQGVVVGYANVGVSSRAVFHAFRWSPATGLVALDTPGDFSAATGLTPSGLIVGYSTDASGQSGACVWPGGSAIQCLPTLGGPAGFADAVNASGLIVGQAQTASGDYHATLWVLGLPTDLTPSLTDSLARSINAAHIIVGEARFPSGYHGMLWTASTGVQDLGVYPGDVNSTATGINDQGDIVGSSTGPGEFPPPQRAVRWVNGQIEDLNTLVTAPGWVLEWAQAINTAGAMVGAGTLNGQRRAWLLVPDTTLPAITIAATPEPLWHRTAGKSRSLSLGQ